MIGASTDWTVRVDSLSYNSNVKSFFPDNSRIGGGPKNIYKYLKLGGACDSLPSAAFSFMGTYSDKIEYGVKKVVCSFGMRYLGARVWDYQRGPSFTPKYPDLDSVNIEIKDFSKIEVLLSNALFTSELPDTIRLPKISWFCKSAFRYRPGMQIYLGRNLKTMGMGSVNYYRNGGLIGNDVYFVDDEVPLNGAKIHIEAINPPKIINKAGFEVLNGDTIYIASGCMEAYMADADWKSFVDNGNIVLVEEPKKLEEITINHQNLLLDIGETAVLTITLTPQNVTDMEIQWSSSDESVVTVNGNGELYAIGSGEAWVYAMSGTITDSCKVTVKTHVVGIAINPEAVTFERLGETKQLEAIISPNNATDKSVIWKSGNEQICMVTSSGYIMALSVGTTVIMATSVDGSIPATCIVTVKDSATGIKSVEVNQLGGDNIYGINGVIQRHPSKGIVIVKSRYGKTKKMQIGK